MNGYEVVITRVKEGEKTLRLGLFITDELVVDDPDLIVAIKMMDEVVRKIKSKENENA